MILVLAFARFGDDIVALRVDPAPDIGREEKGNARQREHDKHRHKPVAYLFQLLLTCIQAIPNYTGGAPKLPARAAVTGGG